MALVHFIEKDKFFVEIISSKFFLSKNIRESFCRKKTLCLFYRKLQLFAIMNRIKPDLRIAFKYLKIIPFVPVKDVIFALDFVKSVSPANFSPMIEYFDKFYIGDLVEGSTLRKVPLFPIKLWILRSRILKDLPRSNNNIEALHKALAQDEQ